ncbi:MAG: hypothetical protein ABEI57_02965, partial [Halapricum sp.]
MEGDKTHSPMPGSDSESVTVEWLDNALSVDEQTERETVRALRRAGLDESVSVEFSSPPMVGAEDIRRILDGGQESPTLLLSTTASAELAPRVLAEQFDLPPIGTLVPDGRAAALRSGLFDAAVRCASA